MALCHWVQLSLAAGIGPILLRRILDKTGSAAMACDIGPAILRDIEGIGPAKATAIFESLRAAARLVDEEIHKAQAIGARIICPDDEEYPPLLKHIPDPPAVLYVKGAIEPRDLNALAIVGSRKCTFYGREQAERFGALLAGAGVTVVSGGARGVDSAAHRGALTHPHGRTLAVLGCGIDIVYPPENEGLFRQIVQRGAILSEYPMGTPPLSENFPRRNRIVSGISRGVLVIEADTRSGALITARQACEDHNRPVFALPGRVDNAQSTGPHRLLREGAILTEGLEDIVENLGPLPEDIEQPPAASETPAAEPPLFDPPVQKPTITLSEQQRLILEQFDGQGMNVDALVERTALPAQAILQELTLLSLKGMLKRVEGQTYARVKQTKERR